MKQIKKLLSLVMAFALICGVFAVDASAADAETGFTDVPSGIWYEEAVNWCRDNGIMGGTSDTAFSPDTTMSRSMLATVLYRAEGSPAVEASVAFSDVAPDIWYTDAVAWASEGGIMGGYGNGIFGPDDPVTREQIAAILWRYAGSPEAESGADFADEVAISTYAVQAVDWVQANDIMNGVGGNRFDPVSSATRAQVALILYRYLSGNTSTPDNSSTETPAEPTPTYEVEAPGEGPASASRISSVAGVPLVTLNNGVQMPQFGLGTQIQSLENGDLGILNETSRESVVAALQAGYRHLDDAHGYLNERGVGQGIIDSGVPREEIWLTSKLWPSEYGDAYKAVNEMLDRLQVEYLDLVYLHHPAGDIETIVSAWQGLEQAYREGKIRALGISNFDNRMEAFNAIMGQEIKPQVMQIECHPFAQRLETRALAEQYNIQVECWYPLGHGDQRLLNADVLEEIAAAHDKSVVQIIIRWHMQEGFSAIPGSTNPAHIQENIDIFDFELSDAEMAQIRAMDQGESGRYFNLNYEFMGGMFANPLREWDASEIPTTGVKTLVVYYSASGNTENVANYIATATGADIFELEPVEPYTDEDLNWTNMNSRVVYEHDNPDARDVELVSVEVPDWDSYDTVFIGYPIWWQNASWVLDGFIAANDFTGKTVIPFCTSSSSGLGQSGELLAEAAGTGNWLEGVRFSSSVSETTVKEWVEGLDL